MKIKPPFVRNPYNYDTNEASDEAGLACPEPTLTQQQFAEESDINYIAERYGLTGELPQVLNLPKYGDYEGIFDFQSAQNAVRKAMEDFMQLPAKLRNRFDNQPQKLLDFINDPANEEEAIFLGLVKKAQKGPQSPEAASDTNPKGEAPSSPQGAAPTPPPAPQN